MKDIQQIITEAIKGKGILGLHVALVRDLKKAGYDTWGQRHYDHDSEHMFGTQDAMNDQPGRKNPATLHNVLAKHGFEFADSIELDNILAKVRELHTNPITGAHITLEYSKRPKIPPNLPKQYHPTIPSRLGPHEFTIYYSHNETRPEHW